MKAFPTPQYREEKFNGMDLRDYFASHAMQAIIANSDQRSIHVMAVDEWVGNYAYTVADAMMKERAR